MTTAQMIQLALQQEKKYGLPPYLLVGLLSHESSFNPTIVSSTGDYGVAQINLASHPSVTAAQAKNPSFAIPWSAQYLSQLYQQAGSWTGALEMYNTGNAKGITKATPQGSTTYAQSVLQKAAGYGSSAAKQLLSTIQGTSSGSSSSGSSSSTSSTSSGGSTTVAAPSGGILSWFTNPTGVLTNAAFVVAGLLAVIGGIALLAWGAVNSGKKGIASAAVKTVAGGD